MTATVRVAVQQRLNWSGAVLVLGAFAAAGGVGGALVGVLLSLLGSMLLRLSSEGVVAVAIGVVAVASLVDLTGLDTSWPHPRRGVPPAWLAWKPALHLPAYGWILGMGLFTPYTAAAMYALAALVIAAGDLLVGATVMGAYGVVRSVAAIAAGAVAARRDLPSLLIWLPTMRTRLRPVLGLTALATVGALYVL